jgi:hypothetical protein
MVLIVVFIEEIEMDVLCNFIPFFFCLFCLSGISCKLVLTPSNVYEVYQCSFFLYGTQNTSRILRSSSLH